MLKTLFLGFFVIKAVLSCAPVPLPPACREDTSCLPPAARENFEKLQNKVIKEIRPYAAQFLAGNGLEEKGYKIATKFILQVKRDYNCVVSQACFAIVDAQLDKLKPQIIHQASGVTQNNEQRLPLIPMFKNKAE